VALWFWQASLGNSNDLFAVQAFWTRLRARINALDDPRLREERCFHIQAGLPEALLTINAQLAVQAAEAGVVEESQRHIALLRSSEFPGSATDAALEAAVASVRDRIKTLLKVGEAEADADAACAAEAARRTLDQTEPLLKVLDMASNAEHRIAEAVVDEVALRVLELVIAYVNKTDNWRPALEVTERCLELARGESARQRIEENHDTMQTKITYGTCYFCGQNPPDEQYAIPIEMYGEVKRQETGYNQIRVTWRTLTVKVPQCIDCHHKHITAESIRNCFVFLIFLASSGLVCVYIFLFPLAFSEFLVFIEKVYGFVFSDNI
jgi:hypothetical protein